MASIHHRQKLGSAIVLEIKLPTFIIGCINEEVNGTKTQ